MAARSKKKKKGSTKKRAAAKRSTTAPRKKRKGGPARMTLAKKRPAKRSSARKSGSKRKTARKTARKSGKRKLSQTKGAKAARKRARAAKTGGTPAVMSSSSHHTPKRKSAKRKSAKRKSSKRRCPPASTELQKAKDAGKAGARKVKRGTGKSHTKTNVVRCHVRRTNPTGLASYLARRTNPSWGPMFSILIGGAIGLGVSVGTRAVSHAFLPKYADKINLGVAGLGSVGAGLTFGRSNPVMAAGIAGGLLAGQFAPSLSARVEALIAPTPSGQAAANMRLQGFEYLGRIGAVTSNTMGYLGRGPSNVHGVRNRMGAVTSAYG